MFNVHKPDWLYEALPYVYGLAGVVTIANRGSALSMLSGGLLVSAGLFIWWMRRSHRKSQKRMKSDRKAAQRRTAQVAESVRQEIERRRNEN